MSDEVTLQIILDELKACRSQIDGLVKDVAGLKAQEAAFTLFWAENWGPLKMDIQAIKNRVDQLEQGDVQGLERRLDNVEADARSLRDAKVADRIRDLEKSEYRRQGVAAAAGAVGGGGIAALFQWLMSGGS